MRARRTAELVTGHTPKIDNALIEMDWGAWEGGHGKRLRADPDSGYRDIEDWGWSYRPPGGESPGDLRDRLVDWARGLSGDNIAVCHIGIMRVLMAHATGWGFSGPAPFQIKRNRLYVIEMDGADWHAWPDTPRLVEAPA
jgi:probable phosphoglycerate mutase